MNFRKLAPLILVPALLLTSCAGDRAQPASPQTAPPTTNTSDSVTCETLYGATLEGPEVRAIDIVRRFEQRPDLSSISNTEVKAADDELVALGLRASPAAATFIATQESSLGQMLEIKETGQNQTIDTLAFKTAGIQLLSLCKKYLSEADSDPMKAASPAAPW
ncbi:hypothetical protein [Subtercola endophyticus]|uniref:hypothetical protein n=1 Tax=Subtercola endophyticus TaxID=2895559 RepID=UPI001E4205D7|nr:hypothetical protein [Subtercola endophyticus]UFS57844.1 hypothetical protein LQ955_12430 [Subtercola endophyticus]